MVVLPSLQVDQSNKLSNGFIPMNYLNDDELYLYTEAIRYLNQATTAQELRYLECLSDLLLKTAVHNYECQDQSDF